jgi:hypothetical protein
MSININELKNDLKRLANLIDEIQKKHGGIYITGCHCEGENQLTAYTTAIVDGRFISHQKFEGDDDV